MKLIKHKIQLQVNKPETVGLDAAPSHGMNGLMLLQESYILLCLQFLLPFIGFTWAEKSKKSMEEWEFYNCLLFMVYALKVMFVFMIQITHLIISFWQMRILQSQKDVVCLIEILCVTSLYLKEIQRFHTSLCK